MHLIANWEVLGEEIKENKNIVWVLRFYHWWLEDKEGEQSWERVKRRIQI